MPKSLPPPYSLHLFFDEKYIQNFASLEAIKFDRLFLTVFQSVFDL